ncbi:restriction endonuclease subunit S [Aeromonas salmonicida subsp. salmonicida]|nr:restriction endonuclease subunit S [Aeromonas salmonicida subsp. salmonicida]
MKWPMTKLSEVCQVNPRLPKDSDESQEVSFLAMASVSEDGVLLNQETRILGETKKGFTYFERGDVIVAKITPCFENGKAAYLDSLQTKIGFGSTEFHVLRPDIDRLDGKYLFYLIWNDKFRCIAERSMSGSAGQKRVPAKFLQDFSIPLPPLEEQKRIAAILDKADTIRQKRQQAIALADDFLRSVFLDMFGDPVTNPKGWDKRPLHEIASHIVDCPHSTPRWTDEGIIALRTSNLTKGGWDWTDKRFVSELEYKERTKRSELVAKDLILSREGTVGIAALVPEGVKMCMGQRLVQIRVNDNHILPEYLLYLILIELEPDRISRLMTGSTSKHINVSDLKALSIMLPPLAIQNKFVETMTFLNGIKERLALFDVDSDMAFDAISQKAFSGQL